MNKRIKKIVVYILVFLVFFLNITIQDDKVKFEGVKVFAATGTKTVDFSSNTYQSQSQTITIPNLVNVSSISVNTGNVNYTTSGNNITINVSNGNSTSQTTGSTSASTYLTNSSDSFPSSISYGGGTLYKSGGSYVTSGSYTPGDSRMEYTSRSASTISGLPSSISYNSGGYSGTLTWSTSPTYSNGMYTVSYSGQVSKPGVDTRVWRQDYSGSIPVTTYYYSYTVTVNYVTNVAPTIGIATPGIDSVYSAQPGKNTLPLSGTIYDSDSGDTETIYYRINGSTGQTGTKFGDSIISNKSNQTYPVPSALTIDVSNVNEGTHKLNVWVKDNYNAVSTEASIYFIIDKTAPVVTAPTLTANSFSQITVQPNAADLVSNGVSSGLDQVSPYKYNRDGTDLQWQSGTLIDKDLQPNKEYAYKYIAQDSVWNQSAYSPTAKIFTLAEVPSLVVNNPTPFTLDISTTDNNPSNTNYKIWTSISGTNYYLTSSGALSTNVQWITLTGKKITSTLPNANTSYTFYAQAMNGNGVVTATSSPKGNKTYPVPPGIPADLIVDTKTIDTTSMIITWSPVSDATGYDVAIDGKTSTPDSTPVPSYCATGLVPGTMHTFSVRARNDEGSLTSGWSNIVSGWTLPGIPSATVSPGSISLNLSWTEVTGATGYDLSINNGDSSDVGTVTSYVYGGLDPNTQYTYKVRAKNVSGAGSWSDDRSVFTLVNIPSNGVVGKTTNTTVNVSWQANGNPEGTQYLIAAFDTNNTLIKQNNWITNLSDTIAGLDPATNYKLKVKAKNGDNIETDWLTISGNVVTLPNPPQVPIGLITVPQSCTSIIISWEVAEGAISYDLMRVDPQNNETVITSIKDTSYTDTDLHPETTYSYMVQAVNEGGGSGYCQGIDQSTMPITPGAITGLVSTSTTSDITLGWNVEPRATGYKIEADGNVLDVGNATTYTFEGLDKGTMHIYRVLAYNITGEGPFSDMLSTATLLDIPNDIAAMSSNSKILVFWSTIENATGYEVTIGDNTYTTTATSYATTGLIPTTTYAYKVRAINAVSASNWSTVGTITTLPNPPPLPVNISSSPDKTSITIKWDAVPEALSYDIMADGQLITGVSTNSFTASGLMPGSSHEYKIRSRNTGGKSAWSEKLILTTLPSEPNVPSNLSDIPTVDSITLQWNAIIGAESYDIEIDGSNIINVTTNLYVHNGLNRAEGHSYKVRSVIAGEQSDWSGTLTAVTRSNDFGIPANIKASPTDTTIELSWDAVSGASGYDVQIDGQTVNAGTNTTYSAIGLQPETNHIIRVRTQNNGEAGDWSQPICVITLDSLLQVPANFTAKAGIDNITLTWIPVIDANSYDIEIDGKTIQNVIGYTYLTSGLSPLTEHVFRIRSRDDNGPGSWSQQIKVTTLSDVPAIPGNINLTATSNSIKVTWNCVENAASYDVEVDGTIINTVDNQIVSTGLGVGTAHTYRVRAVKGTKTSDWSQAQIKSTLPTKPATPQGIKVTPADTTLTVSYNSTAGASGYDIEVDGTVYNNGTQTTYTKTGLLAGTQHSIRVRAKNNGGASDWSSLTTVLTTGSTTGVPTGINSSSTSNTIAFSWNSDKKAKSYDIEVDGVIKNTSNTTFTVTGLVPGTSHQFRIRENAPKAGSWSSMITIATVFDAPNNLNASNQNGDAILKWNPVSGATGYDIEIDGTVVASATGATYTHTGLLPNQSHTYRIRAKNSITTGAWSTALTYMLPSSVYTGTFNMGDEFNFVINVQNIPDINQARFTITYSTDQLEATDLYSVTDSPDLSIGVIPGSNIKVVQFTPGKIVLSVSESEFTGEFSGIVDTITFKAKRAGQASITYSVN